MKTKSRPGYSLLELVVVMVLLGAVMAMATSTLMGLFKIEEAEVRVHDRLMTQGALADQFREDVAGAVAAPLSLEQVKAGPDCLILQNPGNKHVVYCWHKGRLERTDFAADKKFNRPIPVGGDKVEVEFIRQDRLLSLRLLTPGPAGMSVVEIAACLGGDRR